MKKIISIALCALVLVGCNSTNTAETPSESLSTTPEITVAPTIEPTPIPTPEPTLEPTPIPKEAQYSFSIEETQIYLNDSPQELLAIVGEPLNHIEQVIGETEYTIYEFNDLVITTRKTDGEEEIVRLALRTNAYETSEGLKVGMLEEEVVRVYSEAIPMEHGMSYIVELGPSTLQIVVSSGVVIGISYINNEIVVQDIEVPSFLFDFETTIYTDDEAPNYFYYIKSKSAVDPFPSVYVDASSIDGSETGYYDVVYYAIDFVGNISTQTVKYTVAEKGSKYTSPQELDELADQVLATILTEDMTEKEQLTAIYKWIRGNVGYSADPDKADWVQSAYKAIRNKKADCFGYYAVAQELLYRAGFTSIRVQKMAGISKNTHFWNLVDSSKGYYHFDTTPRTAGGTFNMLTDQELEDYSSSHTNSHKFDYELYPSTPEEKY